MDDDQFDAFLEGAIRELKVKQQILTDEYGIGTFARWHLDQEAETLQFFDGQGRLGLTCGYVDIGSYSHKSDTWKWAWSNEWKPMKARFRSERLRELEGITGAEMFGIEYAFEIDLETAWELAAICVMHLSALGCYRAPAPERSLLIFLALTEIHRPA